jgi:uncharacterized protein YaaQ
MKKMIMAVIPQVNSNLVLEALARAGFVATYDEARGGMMHQSKTKLYVAVNENEVETVIGIIRENNKNLEVKNPEDEAKPGLILIDPEKGGSAVFIWDIERVEMI